MAEPTHILGISMYYHDSAETLIKDGEIVAAPRGERFTRINGDASFPSLALGSFPQRAGITMDEVQCVGFYDKPLSRGQGAGL